MNKYNIFIYTRMRACACVRVRASEYAVLYACVSLLAYWHKKRERVICSLL